MNKTAVVDLEKCDTKKCSGHDSGICRASEHCTHKLLVQEEPFNPPMMVFDKMCTGCGMCAKECPLKAIIISGR